MSSSVSRICPSRRTLRTTSARSAETSLLPRTSPSAYAGADAFSTSSLSSTTTALDRSTDSTVPTPSGTTGWAYGGIVRCWRSLMCHARTAPPATTAPMRAARAAWSVGSTGGSVRTSFTGGSAPDADVGNVHPAFTATPRMVTRLS